MCIQSSITSPRAAQRAVMEEACTAAARVKTMDKFTLTLHCYVNVSGWCARVHNTCAGDTRECLYEHVLVKVRV